MHAMMKVGAGNLLPQDVPGVKGTGAGAQFGDVLQNAIKQAADAVGKSEAVERKAALGSVDVHEVATAITDAETMLQTLVGIRDKLVSAYNELVRTPI